jgi:hypothetical protein
MRGIVHIKDPDHYKMPISIVNMLINYGIIDLKSS